MLREMPVNPMSRGRGSSVLSLVGQERRDGVKSDDARRLERLLSVFCP